MKQPVSFPIRCSSGLPILALGVIAALAGVHQRNPALIAVGCVFISVPLVVFALLRRGSRHLEFFRHLPESAFEGDPVRVELSLRNNSDQAVYFPQVCEVFPPEIHAQKNISYSGRIASRESAAQSYVGHCILPRGRYTIGPTALRVADPLGWFEVNCTANAEQSLKVYPQVYRFEANEYLGRCISLINSDRTTRGVGESTEFHTVREYRSGDSKRKIHWGLTARRGYPIVREFARDAVGDLSVVLDASSEALVGWGRSSSTEYAVKIALAVISHALNQGRSAQLVYSQGGLGEVIETESRDGFQRFLDAMVTFKAGEPHCPLTDFIAEIGNRLPAGGTLVIMVSPYLFGDPRLEAVLSGWVRRFRVFAVLFDGLRFGPVRGTGHDEEGDEITAFQYSAHLARLGVETFPISCGDSLDSVFPEAAQTIRRVGS